MEKQGLIDLTRPLCWPGQVLKPVQRPGTPKRYTHGSSSRCTQKFLAHSRWYLDFLVGPGEPNFKVGRWSTYLLLVASSSRRDPPDFPCALDIIRIPRHLGFSTGRLSRCFSYWAEKKSGTFFSFQFWGSGCQKSWQRDHTKMLLVVVSRWLFRNDVVKNLVMTADFLIVAAGRVIKGNRGWYVKYGWIEQ